MPEELGPEPQELLEQTEHNKHHAEHGEHEEHEEGAEKAFTMRAAICASILAVGAALASLLSGHAANEAILKATQASDQWAYYQAKSTKSHIFEGNKYVVEAMADVLGKTNSEAVAKAQKQFDANMDKFDKEKTEIQKGAEDLQHESNAEFNKHQKLSLAVACFQIGIVLSSVSIMVRARWLYLGSLLAGVIGVLYVAFGCL